MARRRALRGGRLRHPARSGGSFTDSTPPARSPARSWSSSPCAAAGGSDVVAAHPREPGPEALLAGVRRRRAARPHHRRPAVPAARRQLVVLVDDLALRARDALVLAHAPVRLLVDERPDDRA